jgi:hypothetical protein
MAGLHIGRDAQGYSFLSHEADDGTLRLLAHQVPSRDMLVEKVNELTASGPFAGLATFIDDEDLLFEQARLAKAAPDAASMAPYTRPEPRLALRPWK